MTLLVKLSIKVVYMHLETTLKAKILKKRTGEPITRLRSRKAGHYFVSLPGTIAIVRDGQVEWYTIGVQEIINFVKKVLSNGHTFLRECCG